MISNPPMPGIWMSRNTTSGASVSSDARVSPQSRHSPTTRNAGNAASNCRTPRRAAGSSSAMSTRHSFAIAWLRRPCSIRNPEDRCGAARVRATDRERRQPAVHHVEALARVRDAVTWRHLVDRDPNAVVFYSHHELLVLAAGADGEGPGAGLPGDAVADRVLDEVLDGEARKHGIEDAGVDTDDRPQAVGK